MILKNSGLLPLMLSCTVFFSCTEDEQVSPYGDGSEVPLLVAGRIYSYDGTDSGVLNHSEHIGVYMAEYPSTGEIAYSNLGYTATYGSRDEYFNPDDYGNIPGFSKNDGRKWSVWAYYPYDEAMSGHIVVSVSDQTSVSETTLLYARATGLDWENNTAWLNLAPALSKLHFEFSAGAGVTSLSGMSVRLSGFPAIGNFDLSTCSFSVPEGASHDISVPVSGDGVLSAEALVIPQTSTDGCDVKISLPGESFERTFCIRDYAAGLAKGVQYDFAVTVNRASVNVVLTSSSAIPGWEESGGVELVPEEND